MVLIFSCNKIKIHGVCLAPHVVNGWLKLHLIRIHYCELRVWERFSKHFGTPMRIFGEKSLPEFGRSLHLTFALNNYERDKWTLCKKFVARCVVERDKVCRSIDGCLTPFSVGLRTSLSSLSSAEQQSFRNQINIRTQLFLTTPLPTLVFNQLLFALYLSSSEWYTPFFNAVILFQKPPVMKPTNYKWFNLKMDL